MMDGPTINLLCVRADRVPSSLRHSAVVNRFNESGRGLVIGWTRSFLFYETAFQRAARVKCVFIQES